VNGSSTQACAYWTVCFSAAYLPAVYIYLFIRVTTWQRRQCRFLTYGRKLDSSVSRQQVTQQIYTSIASDGAPETFLPSLTYAGSNVQPSFFTHTLICISNCCSHIAAIRTKVSAESHPWQSQESRICVCEHMQDIISEFISNLNRHQR
jgi:hypothetical protein